MAMVRVTKSSTLNAPRRFTLCSLGRLALTATAMAIVVFIASGGNTSSHRHCHPHYCDDPGLGPHLAEHQSLLPDSAAGMPVSFIVEGAWKSFRAAKGLSALPEVASVAQSAWIPQTPAFLLADSNSAKRALNRFDIDARRRFRSGTGTVRMPDNQQVFVDEDQTQAATLALALAQLHLAADARPTTTVTMEEVIATFRGVADQEGQRSLKVVLTADRPEKDATERGEDRDDGAPVTIQQSRLNHTN